MGNLVAIVGRPNVGKSTLFNRLTKTRKAIVQETSGVTRDRHYGKSIWSGREFSVVDTGGFVKGSDDIFEDEIRKQVLIAIEECNVVIFVVDVETGITDLDEAVAGVLRQTKKPVFVVSNLTVLSWYSSMAPFSVAVRRFSVPAALSKLKLFVCIIKPPVPDS